MSERQCECDEHVRQRDEQQETGKQRSLIQEMIDERHERLVGLLRHGIASPRYIAPGCEFQQQVERARWFSG
ncbi:hypothetical protein ACIBH1_45215 [Nonomuraea sp. NPDC050663]|uniref:hypothetical protein n=1 Tax=Nonomuraea sp. NPDC050663 TaxID=3364370 RepID=UPI003792D7ED